MCRAAKECAILAKGIVDACWKDALDNANVICTDTTGVLVQNADACKRGHFFVAIADRDYVFFHYTPKHTSDVPRAMLKGFRGYVQADASSVYDAMFGAEGAPIEVGCLAHARRKFFEAVRENREPSLTAIGLFGRLFTVEREIRDLIREETPGSSSRSRSPHMG